MEILGRRELIVLARSDAGLRAGPPGVEVAGPGEAVMSMLRKVDARIEPLFGVSEARLRMRAEQGFKGGPPTTSREGSVDRMSRFFRVVAKDGALDDLAWELRKAESVEAAYVKPAATTPSLNTMLPSSAVPPVATPNFTPLQGYLGPAPGGVDVAAAAGLPGGDAAGVRLIDLEWGWRFTHEDLLNACGVVAGDSHPTQTNHGTAVLGELVGSRNAFGVTGICPEACASAVSFHTLPTATAIRNAADRLRPGDVMLLEIHRPGPNATGNGQDGHIAVEWWPDDFDAIQYAVGRGIVVVEAAGNGAEDLDSPAYGNPQPGFPASWRNPFDPNNASSGAIVVGAGAPPSGAFGPDRSRLDFSNFGARVDAQGWGREVTTTGYGDLQGGPNPDEWYTARFSGTSSASPIVAGVLACAQGILRARGRAPLDSFGAIGLLRATGSPQQHLASGPPERIGNRPDLRQIIPLL